MARFPVFTPEELKGFREVIDRHREPGSYEPGRWSVSPLNRRADVVGRFPRKVVLRDIALRTTDQMPGVVLAPEARLKFMRAIAEAGVPSMQIGAFGRARPLEQMKAETDLIRAINPKCEIVYGGVRNRVDMELAARAGIDSVQFWAAPYVEASPMYAGQGVYQKAWKGEDWREVKLPRSEAEQMDGALEIVRWGHELGVRASAGINQIAFAPESYVIGFCQAMQAAKASEIVLYDGSSGMGPEAYEHMVRLAKTHAPDASVGVHTHNMHDLAVASALASARGGAEVLEVSVNGYCSASGQADLAATALALESLYGIATGLALERLTPLARLGEEITGYKLAWNSPVTGPEVFNWGGTEFVIQELKVDPLVHWCIEPSLVGNVRRWDITFDSGPYTMLDKLGQLGIEVDPAHVEPILERVKHEMRSRRRVLGDDEVREIARSVAGQAPKV